MEHTLKIGDKIPRFSVRDYEGIELESDDLIGNPFVLYFYPKDDTPGCIMEACSFRDKMEIFDHLDTLVIGISPDSPESHQTFIKKHHLNFTLLCDETMDVAKKFGAIQEKVNGDKRGRGILRSTFVIDAAGIVRWIEQPVSIDGHSERVLAAVEQVAK
jgi:thioredoxin-dependent peroxiredoxin